MVKVGDDVRFTDITGIVRTGKVVHLSPLEREFDIVYTNDSGCIRLETMRSNGVYEICEDKDPSQTAKADAGKLQLTLVPTQLIKDVAEVRMYGNKKYHDPDNWKTVDVSRYKDAAFRHLLTYLDDPDGVDEESGIPHYKHLACNVAFICALEAEKKKGVKDVKEE